MTVQTFEQTLSDLIGFQCSLVALRGVGTEASEEMLWQTLLAALVEQYGFARVWYGRTSAGGIRPAVSVPVLAPGMEDLPAEVDEDSAILSSADITLPVTIDGHVEGRLVMQSGGAMTPERICQLRMLAAEAAGTIAERRARGRADEQLRRAMWQAESANRAKSLLLANMSHEIRTPMTGVVGFANLLAGTALSAEQRDYVEGIRSSGEALLTLINDILDFSKIEAGKLDLERRPFDLRNAVQKAVALLVGRAEEKGLRMKVAIDGRVPEAIVGDAGRLRQVLINLVGNAIKFTAAGEVSVSVTAGEPCGRARVSFVVRDTGPGIAREHQQRIFESFSQVDASISRKFGGTGLGLAISKSLVEQMGGSLRVESEPGHGAAFHFSIVGDVADAPMATAPAPVSTGRSSNDLPALRVIVADDNAVNRKVALSFLKRLGYLADSAGNGVELMERLQGTVYDVVFMDVQMPEMDGLEATRRIRRELPPLRQPRIVAMTAAAFPEDRERCLSTGMDDYVSKPVGMEDLAAVLRGSRRLQ